MMAAAGEAGRPARGANPLIVALDLPDLTAADELARSLAGEVAALKVGFELFGAHGPEAVRRLAPHAPVFLDVKLHDIPTTVERATSRLGALGVSMLTVHASGGAAMVAAAVGAARRLDPPPLVLGVTVLTSLSDDDLAALNQPAAAVQVPALARLAVDAGAPGLVCAPRDLRSVRERVGPDVALVTPAVRPAGVGDDDHARGATPAAAMEAGADYLVVGRPVTRAADPVAAAREIRGQAASHAAGRGAGGEGAG